MYCSAFAHIGWDSLGFDPTDWFWSSPVASEVPATSTPGVSVRGSGMHTFCRTKTDATAAATKLAQNQVYDMRIAAAIAQSVSDNAEAMNTDLIDNLASDAIR